MRKNNRKGFTITELVIVIAVIAILAAVLIPTFTSIITKAQQSSAMQEARAAFTEYMASVDYAEGKTPASQVVIKGGDYYFVAEDGKFDDTAYASELAAFTGAAFEQADGDANDYVLVTKTGDAITATAQEKPAA